MDWIKGIRQLHSANSILAGLVDDIIAGENINQKEIPERITTTQSALEDAKKYFVEGATA